MWRELVGNYNDFMGLSRDIGDFQRAPKMKPFKHLGLFFTDGLKPKILFKSPKAMRVYYY